MAISWGGYSTINGVRVRAGVEHTVSPASPSPSTSSVTVTTRIYLGAGDPGWGNGSWEAYNGASGSGSFSWNLARGQQLLVATVTTNVSLIYGQTQSWIGGGRVRPFTSSTGTVSRSASVTIPARPVSVPTAPSSITLSRVSDTRQNLSWTRNATSGAPYDRQEVRRRETGTGAPFVTIATLSGTATSYADTSTQAGRRYDYAVLASNSAGGAAGYAPTPWSTTPSTPARPTVSKQANGDIVVSRPALSNGATWSVRHVETGTVLASGLTGSSWTHVDPSPTQTWTYQVRASSATPVLHSAWSASSTTIQLVAAPLAPTTLGPAAADPSEAVTLQWRHNPVDGTPQRLYQVETRASAGDSWTALTGQVSSSAEQHVVPAGTWSTTPGRQWRVRTWGQHADPSPYSTTAILALSTRPVASITQPDGTHDSPALTVRWTYFDPEGTIQTGWRVELRAGSLVLENRSGSGAATAVTLRTELGDGDTYTVRVEVRDGAGLWSLAASETFTVTYAPPSTPVLQAEFRRDEGYVVLTPDASPQGDRQPLSHLRVERATPDGWLVVEDNVAPGGAVVDMLPPLGTVVVYRAVAVAVIGSVAYSTPEQVETKTKWVFLNHGPGFGSIVRVYGNLEAGRTFSREKTLKRYAGRALPVERAGIAREATYSLTGTLFAPWAPPDLTSSYDDFVALADAAAPVCVRDPEGVRMFVSTSGVDLSEHLRVHRRVSLTMTQVDYPEQGLL